MKPGKVLKHTLLDYELRSSLWAHYVSWGWAQSLAGRYFAWKVNRKFNRWVKSLQQQYSKP